MAPPARVRGAVLSWIRENPGQPLYTKALAAQLGCSKRFLEIALLQLCASGAIWTRPELPKNQARPFWPGGGDLSTDRGGDLFPREGGGDLSTDRGGDLSHETCKNPGFLSDEPARAIPHARPLAFSEGFKKGNLKTLPPPPPAELDRKPGGAHLVALAELASSLWPDWSPLVCRQHLAPLAGLGSIGELVAYLEWSATEAADLGGLVCPPAKVGQAVRFLRWTSQSRPRETTPAIAVREVVAAAPAVPRPVRPGPVPFAPEGGQSAPGSLRPGPREHKVRFVPGVGPVAGDLGPVALRSPWQRDRESVGGVGAPPLANARKTEARAPQTLDQLLPRVLKGAAE